MENNEDNRQMTVIAEALKNERQYEREAGVEAQSAESDLLRDTWNQQKLQHSYTISVLESLLPKEREMIVKSHEAGQAYAIGSHKDFKQTHPNAEEYYSQFKPYEK